MAPFIILSLPRSRSTWLSSFLSWNTYKVGHDIAPDCQSIREFLRRVRELSGSVETGAMLGWKLLVQDGFRILTVRRPPAEVAESLSKFGIDWVQDELIAKDKLLDEVEQVGGVHSISYQRLNSPKVLEDIFEWAHGEKPPKVWIESLVQQNIQTNVVQALARLQANAVGIERMKAECAAMI